MRLALRSFVVIILPVWWGRGDSNPHALRHMILSHACLPIPALPHERKLASIIVPEKVNQIYATGFLNSRRQGLSKHPLIFYLHISEPLEHCVIG